MVGRRIGHPRGGPWSAGREAPLVAIAPEAVARRLEARYGPPVKPRLDPLDELILTILSQNTTDANRDRAWRALEEKVPTWSDLLSLSRSTLEDTIRPAGLVTQKAAAIRGVIERLQAEHPEAPSVAAALSRRLATCSDAEAMAYLTGFKGVGVKTAACVLCFSLGRPVLPVDTHVHRLVRRLGWVDPKASATVAHDTLAGRVPPDLKFPLHIHLIELGRELCTARRPDCSNCPLEDCCPQVGLA